MAKQNEGNKRNRDIENDKMSLEPEGRSPKSKRSRQTEKMIMWDELKDEDELIMITSVINVLEQKTKKDYIKKLIDCYNPLIREETDEIKKYIISCCEGWDDKEEKIIETINYVWPDSGMDLRNIKEVGKLAECLIMALETLTPKMCKECDCYYMVNRNYNPTVRCMWCKVGAHDCIDRGNKEKLKGMLWMCKICSEIMDNQILPKIDLVKKMELIRNQTTLNFEGFEKKDKKRSIDENKSKTNTVEDEEQNNSNKDKDSNSSASDNNGSNNGSVSGSGDSDNDEDNNSSGRSGASRNGGASNNSDNNNRGNCWHFINRACKFGITCRNIHPEVCKSWSEYGNCKNSRCKLAHPKRCRMFDEQGICHRNNCWYIHTTKMGARDQRPYQRTYQRNISQRQNQGFHINQGSSSFLENWPSPAEASMNMHQTIARLIGTMEKVDARMENIERKQMNRWM